MMFCVVPRHSSCCLVRQPFSYFRGEGGSAANAPFRRYRNIPKVVLARPRGVMGLSAMHDITTYAIPSCSSIFNDIPVYSVSFQGRPWQHDFSWRSTIFLDILRFSVFSSTDTPRCSKIFLDIPWYSSTCSQLPRPWHHYIPSDSTMLLDFPWYSSICKRPSKADHGIMIFHDISRYSVIFKYTQRAANTYHVVCVTGITVEAILRDLTAIRR